MSIKRYVILNLVCGQGTTFGRLPKGSVNLVVEMKWCRMFPGVPDGPGTGSNR